MATNQNPNPDFFTTLTKDFFTVSYKGKKLFTICPLVQAEPRKQVQINLKNAQKHIKAIEAGKCTLANVQEQFNQLSNI